MQENQSEERKVLLKLLEVAMAAPTSNANCERAFYVSNKRMKKSTTELNDKLDVTIRLQMKGEQWGTRQKQNNNIPFELSNKSSKQLSMLVSEMKKILKETNFSPQVFKYPKNH